MLLFLPFCLDYLLWKYLGRLHFLYSPAWYRCKYLNIIVSDTITIIRWSGSSSDKRSQSSDTFSPPRTRSQPRRQELVDNKVYLIDKCATEIAAASSRINQDQYMRIMDDDVVAISMLATLSDSLDLEEFVDLREGTREQCNCISAQSHQLAGTHRRAINSLIRSPDYLTTTQNEGNSFILTLLRRVPHLFGVWNVHMHAAGRSNSVNYILSECDATEGIERMIAGGLLINAKSL